MARELFEMAKFARFDPRNAKQGRNQLNSETEVRIKTISEVDELNGKVLLREVIGEDDYIDDKPKNLKG